MKLKLRPNFLEKGNSLNWSKTLFLKFLVSVKNNFFYPCHALTPRPTGVYKQSLLTLLLTFLVVRLSAFGWLPVWPLPGEGKGARAKAKGWGNGYTLTKIYQSLITNATKFYLKDWVKKTTFITGPNKFKVNPTKI